MTDYMTDETMNSREASRRASIEQNIISSILKLDMTGNMIFAPEALKNMSSNPVSLKVVKEIIENSGHFENIDSTTGTTKLLGRLLELKYKFQIKEGGLTFSEIKIGGAKIPGTNVVEKTLKNVLMRNDGSIKVKIVADRGLGTWELNISSIEQKLPNGTVLKRELIKNPITYKVTGDNKRNHDKYKETKITP